MKVPLIAIAALSLAVSGANARTWTSSDGEKTFEGELRSYNERSGIVTVVISGRAVDLPKDKLSAEDINFLEAAKTPEIAATPDTETEVGAKVDKAKLQRLDGKRYRRSKLEKNPQYYLFYFSASW
jgi:hypothetical protein|tara:strand:- start:973 stop:1350 length:378 start_codon:yes stop_codon:yes gene_type:complete